MLYDYLFFYTRPRKYTFIKYNQSIQLEKKPFSYTWVCCGYGLVQAICTVAIATVGSVLSSALSVLKYAGGIYMIYLSIQIIRSSPHNTETEEYPSFKKGLLLQLINVKIYFYIISLLTAYFIPYSKNAFSLALWGIFAVIIGSMASLTWAYSLFVVLLIL